MDDIRFENLPLAEPLRQGIADLGWNVLTPIQARTIPPLLEGKDLIGCAQTGSGKTGAFAIPILQRLVARPGKGVRALILAPTRELAAQIDEAFQALSYHAGIPSFIVQGGVDFDPQTRALKAGVNVIVATPGRLLDHLGRGYVQFDAIEVFVLDEADRMLDMGFLPDVRQIMRWVPNRRQTLLFSATMPKPIVDLAGEILRDPVEVRIELATRAASGVRQHLVEMEESQKTPWLVSFLRREREGSTLVFTRTKIGANRLHRALQRTGLNVNALHSGKRQEERDATLLAFRNGQVKVLVATDVASRGLDIDRVARVVNYDVPDEPDTYVHRAGRTGRYDQTGDAWTLACRAEGHKVRAIDAALGTPIPRVVSGLPAVTDAARAGHSGAHTRDAGARSGEGRHHRRGRRSGGHSRGART